MAKATPKNITDLGFKPGQFSNPPDWDDSDDVGYLQSIINDAATQVSARVGATAYAAATAGDDLRGLKKAEVYLTAAELWRRLEQFEAANLNTARSSEGQPTISSRYLNNAGKAEQTAEDALADFVGNSTLAVGTVETGHFPEVGS